MPCNPRLMALANYMHSYMVDHALYYTCTVLSKTLQMLLIVRKLHGL